MGHLKKLSSLKKIYAYNNPASYSFSYDYRAITHKGLEALKNLPIQNLGFCNHRYINDGLQHFAKNLSSLSLLGCKVTDDKMSLIAKLSLNFLQLGDLEITDLGFQKIKNLSLTSLDITNCPSITSNGLEFISEMPLKSLTLCKNERISNIGLSYINCENLT